MKNIPQKEGRNQPKIKTEMNGKGLTVLLPVLTFMGKLLFRERIHDAVDKECGANAEYQFADIVQMVVIGLIAGATHLLRSVKRHQMVSIHAPAWGATPPCTYNIIRAYNLYSIFCEPFFFRITNHYIAKDHFSNLPIGNMILICEPCRKTL